MDQDEHKFINQVVKTLPERKDKFLNYLSTRVEEKEKRD